VGDGEFVIAGGQAAPVLDGVEGTFDHVAALVFLAVESDGPAASGASTLAVTDLERRFWDDGLDTPGSQMDAVRP